MIVAAEKITTEVAVVGAGPGGYAAAFRLADLGKEVVLIDREQVLGGVCLNRGCIPSKALLHVARVIEEARDLSQVGVEFQDPVLDLDRIREWKDKVVAQLTGGLTRLAEARKVATLQGQARFLNPREVAVDGPEGEVVVSFQHAVIATGSSPSTIPGLPSHPGIMDSSAALELETIPDRLLVIGGGYIGLELGTVYQALGSRVTVVEMLASLLPGADPDLVRPLARRLKGRWAEIKLGTQVVGVQAAQDGTLRVDFKSADEKSAADTFDRILVSVGRRPNSAGLGLEKAGINVDENSFIPVDPYRRTSAPHIYAIGDVAGEPLLAHKATHEGKVAAEAICGLPAAYEPRAVPAVIFTDPEIAWAGLTETEAVEKGITYDKGEFPWVASGRSLTVGRREGKTKLLFEPESRRLLGVGIVGTNAGDLISEGALAVELGADAEDIGLTIHPHPTFSETLGLAAEAYSGTITDLYHPKK